MALNTFSRSVQGYAPTTPCCKQPVKSATRAASLGKPVGNWYLVFSLNSVFFSVEETSSENDTWNSTLVNQAR